MTRLRYEDRVFPPHWRRSPTTKMTFGTMHTQLARHSLIPTRVAISKQSNYPMEETYSILISEVTELLIRDHTSRITPAGVSSRGALLLREAEPKAAWMDKLTTNKVTSKRAVLSLYSEREERLVCILLTSQGDGRNLGPWGFPSSPGRRMRTRMSFPMTEISPISHEERSERERGSSVDVCLFVPGDCLSNRTISYPFEVAV